MVSGSDGGVVARRLEDEIDLSPVRVSYIITTLNRGEYLRKTLLNVREFLSNEDELIIVDGGSVDCTAEVVQQNSDIVSIFVSERDFSEGHAFNKGLSLARGRFIKPITDDDYFYPDAMRCLVAAGELLPEVDAITTGGEMWQIEDGEPKFVDLHRLWRIAEEPENVSQLEIFDCHIGLGLLVRRRAVLKTGGISPGYLSADGDLHCKLVEAKCDVRYLDINLYRWYGRPHSGAANVDKMTLSRMMFAFRLRAWKGFYGLEPSVAARIMGLDATPEGVGFQYSIYLLHRIWRSRFKMLLRLSPFLLDFRRCTRRVLRSFLGRGLNAKPVELGMGGRPCIPFTGKLLPKSQISELRSEQLMNFTRKVTGG